MTVRYIIVMGGNVLANVVGTLPSAGDIVKFGGVYYKVINRYFSLSNEGDPTSPLVDSNYQVIVEQFEA